VRYKAFDIDPTRVQNARDIGLPVFYGDARRPEVRLTFLIWQVLLTFMREAEADICNRFLIWQVLLTFMREAEADICNRLPNMAGAAHLHARGGGGHLGRGGGPHL
jgi:hypothetical protein